MASVPSRVPLDSAVATLANRIGPPRRKSSVQEVQGRCEIICDGGIRRGSDILKAVALGATATMGGRAYLFGLGAAGERGVDTALGFLRAELVRAMALNGLTSFDDVGPHIVAPVS